MTLSDAYVAGLVDGEGTIRLAKNSKKSRGVTHYGPALEIGMTTPALPTLRILHARHGGSLRKSRDATEDWAEAWMWSLHGSGAVALVERILPHLMVKQEHARLVLRFWELRCSMLSGKAKAQAHWTTEGTKRAEAMYLAMKDLNKKGPRPTVPSGAYALRVAGQWVGPQSSLFDDLGWEAFSGPWPTSGSMRDGACFERPTWGHPISAPASSLLPTPRTSDTNGAGGHGDGGRDLRTTVSFLLPTPTCGDAIGARNKTSGRKPDSKHHSGTTLTDAFWTGDRTDPPSNDGKPSTDPHQPPLPTEG